MTARTPTYLKSRFEQNDIPQGTDYEDLIDSFINIATSASQAITGPINFTNQLDSAAIYASFVSAASINTSFIEVTTASAAFVRANAVSADSLNVSGNVIFGSFDVSAVATTQASAALVNGTTNFVIFANGNDQSVRLPPSTRGRQQYIVNAASTTIRIFPAVSGRFLVTAVNAPLNLPADRIAFVIHQGNDRYGVVIGGF